MTIREQLTAANESGLHSVSTRRAQTRRKLLDAAQHVFATTGVQASSVEQICERAGFTRGAFYSNFSSKDDLCTALLAEKRSQQLASVEKALLGVAGFYATDLTSVIEGAISLFVEAQQNDSDWVLAANELRLYAARNTSIRQAYLRYVHETATMFLELVLPAMERASYKFAMPPTQALAILQAVWELSLLDNLIYANRVGDDDQIEYESAKHLTDVRTNLTALLTTMVIPIAGQTS